MVCKGMWLWGGGAEGAVIEEAEGRRMTRDGDRDKGRRNKVKRWK